MSKIVLLLLLSISTQAQVLPLKEQAKVIDAVLENRLNQLKRDTHTEVRTQAKGFKVLCANHYTIRVASVNQRRPLTYQTVKHSSIVSACK